MSWSLRAFPLHIEGAYQFFSQNGAVLGLPATPPASQPLPVAQAILWAFREAECHGDLGFWAEGFEGQAMLAACPDRWSCVASHGVDLGEVTLFPQGRRGSIFERRAVWPDSPIEHISFRNPLQVR